jgi:response regulator of citrate/malate metabolism
MCPVVAITACKDNSIEDDAKMAGVSKVLYKPIDFRILKQTLNTYYYY